MGLRLDWEIESEQHHIRQESGEDPESRRQRRRRRLMILMLPLVLLLLAGLVAAFVVYRLERVEAEIERVVRDTVDAEIATLRLGDEIAFMGFQRSATDTWLTTQQSNFDYYQTLKQTDSVELTGQVLDVSLDDHRARVQVLEILEGAPYVRTWFYWRYADGWRHVPPDYTFWGEVATLEGDGLAIRHQVVDESLARAMRDSLSTWRQTACASLGCEGLSALRVEILPDPALMTGWAEEDEWLLKVRSPYTHVARQDNPFDFTMQFDLANLLAERFVAAASGGLQPVYPADAFYLRSSIVSWLVGRFLSVNTNAFLMSSLAQNYGEQAVGNLLRALQPDSGAALFNGIIDTTSLAQANLDWRDFLTWRLALEDELIRRGDETNYLLLYDTRDEAARLAAYERYNAGASGANRVIVSAAPETAPDGAYQLRGVMEVGSPPTGREEVLFLLVDERWLRAN